MTQNNQQQGIGGPTTCSYPSCNCPFDAPSDPNWCARGLTRAAPSPQIAEVAELPHADDVAVDRFAVALKEKMAQSRAKGRAGWESRHACPTARLQTMLLDHVLKGDPVDVGNFCMMLWSRGEPTKGWDLRYATAPGGTSVGAEWPAKDGELERLREIARLIGSIFVHGDFKAETHNERELEKLLRAQGTFYESLDDFDADRAAPASTGQAAAVSVAETANEKKWRERASAEREKNVLLKAQIDILEAAAQPAEGSAPALEHRTCCDHPDCTRCAGRGGFYRMPAEGSAQVAKVEHTILSWGGSKITLDSLLESLHNYSRIMPGAEGRAKWAMREAAKYIEATRAAPASSAQAAPPVAMPAPADDLEKLVREYGNTPLLGDHRTRRVVMNDIRAEARRMFAAPEQDQGAAVAAIQFALEDEDGLDFLSYWNEGEFDVIRRNWEHVPEAVFIGADPLHPATKALEQRLAAALLGGGKDGA